MKADVEQFIAKQIKGEWDASAMPQDASDFESVVDLLECKRTEKNYAWLSDVFYPEYPAVLLTESSQWANQYFASRDFVDVYLEGDGPTDKEKCATVKKLLNKTLNRRGLYHYHKYMRARTINSTAGVVYAVCGWNQLLQPTVVGTRKVPDGGSVMLPTGIEVPTFRDEEVMEDQPLQDWFEYDVFDPRNVRTDNTYCYSLQQKMFVLLRSEESYEDLKLVERENGYINLDRVKELLYGGNVKQTETATETTQKDTPQAAPDKPVVRKGDLITRYGKLWAVVKSRDEYGNPAQIDYGYDDLGAVKEKAELVEGISAIFYAGSTPVLIRYQASPFIDGAGNPYRPIVRGLCYIHPTKDTGMSDGKYARESQVALNDTINISNDRVKLATMPVFVGDKYACEDNDQIFIEPEHVIPMEGGPDKLKELDIRDNIGGAMQQAQMFISGIQKVTSVFPTTMGDVPGQASTTATAVAGADARSNIRANYKSLTFEYTFLVELYWMALQMSYRFMHPMTALKMLGQDGVMVYDPVSDYTYQPVSSNIEQEHGKARKLQIIDQMVGRLVNVPNPKTPALINKLTAMAFDLLGAEYQDIKDSLLDEGPAGQAAAMGMVPGAGGEGGGNVAAGAPTGMTSNQNRVPVTGAEMMARGM